MIAQKLRRSGNSFVVTIPREEVERQGLVEGEMVIVEVRATELRPKLSPGLANVFQESYRDNEEGLRYLKDF